MLDPRLLRAFVAIADQQSFTSAAARLNMTQSTISQQLARLEQAVGHALIDRAARPVLPTPAGERLLGYARRILALQDEATGLLADPAGTTAVRIGVPDDIVTPDMARVFAAFSEAHRETRLDVTTGLSRELTRRYRNGEFDIIVVKEHNAAADCRASFPEPMAWFESAVVERQWPDPVPLVSFPPGGLYRDEMFARIEQEQRRWYIAFTGSSLSGVLVAIEAGMGISLLPRRSTSGRQVRIHRALGDEQPMAASLYAWEATGPISRLVADMAEVLSRRSKAPSA
ncbi:MULTISPECIES: LysR family transcriptional regulator [unclassified Sphingomonas]|uniref:LysR family transcriptional regulator n=1 Tax=unclassified Sphingomonas TaxID=196159 RepID=UPI00092C3BBA|nr:MULTISPECIES: LysR family transcriptional regulator [unclassified Sphingomonas]MBN8847904.1 LysR family transcriptional regulator [Sphingomonas sp.]OJV34245.1 MAG: LuxR family transcriptional regulator [Sphingomonas sp. 67-36]